MKNKKGITLKERKQRLHDSFYKNPGKIFLLDTTAGVNSAKKELHVGFGGSDVSIYIEKWKPNIHFPEGAFVVPPLRKRSTLGRICKIIGSGRRLDPQREKDPAIHDEIFIKVEEEYSHNFKRTEGVITTTEGYLKENGFRLLPEKE